MYYIYLFDRYIAYKLAADVMHVDFIANAITTPVASWAYPECCSTIQKYTPNIKAKPYSSIIQYPILHLYDKNNVTLR